MKGTKVKVNRQVTPWRSLLHAGRIYQNPNNRHELWVNIGWAHQSSQVTPEYQSWLQPHVSRKTFHNLTNFLVEQLDRPHEQKCDGCACVLCVVTAGCCFYPLFHLRRKEKKFESTLMDRFVHATSEVKENVSLRNVPHSTLSGDLWLDSYGQALMIENTKNRAGPGGPPAGFSLVFTVQEIIQWPPEVTVKTMERNNVCDRKYLLYI